jgi:hypothetical protein
MATIDDERNKYLMLLLDHCLIGSASDEERRAIRETSGHFWTSGMVRQDDDAVNSHLLEWVDAADHTLGMRLTVLGAFWGTAAKLAAGRGQSVAGFLTDAAAGLAG